MSQKDVLDCRERLEKVFWEKGIINGLLSKAASVIDQELADMEETGLVLLSASFPREHKHFKPEVDYTRIVCPFDNTDYSLLSILEQSPSQATSLHPVEDNSAFQNFTDFINYSGLTDMFPFQWCRKSLEHDWTWGFVPHDQDCTGKVGASSWTIYGYLQREILKFLTANYTGHPAPSNAWRQPRCFDSNSDLNDYLTSSNYLSVPQLCFAVVFDTVTEKSLYYDIRYNFTNTSPDSATEFYQLYPIYLTNYMHNVNKFQHEVDTSYQSHFIESGFLQIMNILTNFFLSTIGKTLTTYVTPMPQIKYIKDNFSGALSSGIGYWVACASIIASLRFSYAIASDKQRRRREIYYRMGMTDSQYWLSWVISYSAVTLLSSGLCTLISIPIFQYQDKFLLFMLFLLTNTSFVSAGMVFGSTTSQPKVAVATTVSVFLWTLGLSADPMTSFEPSNQIKTLMSLLSPIATIKGFQTLLVFEYYQVSITIENVNTQYQNYSVLDALVSLVVDTAVYFLIGLYLDQVVPRNEGAPQPWYFPLSPAYWIGKAPRSRITRRQLREFQAEDRQHREHMLATDAIQPFTRAEQEQRDSHQTLVISGLRKHYRTVTVVEGLELELFRGEIFVLLGANGAGKSSTISILAGLVTPTSGNILVDGLSYRDNHKEIHQKIGMCSRYSHLFPHMTVEGHLKMFCRIRGLTKANNIDHQVQTFLTHFGLAGCRRAQVRSLAESQKQTLSVALAFVGFSPIIVLDEPTSSMDSIARQKIWKLITTYKRDRIILVMTQNTVEADALGDRIGVLQQGRLSCIGGSSHLKSHFGEDYILTITGGGSDDICKLVQEQVVEATVVAATSLELSFRIPLSGCSHFDSLFEELNTQKEALDINNIQLSMGTLDNVFLNMTQHNSAGERVNTLQNLSIHRTPSELEDLELLRNKNAELSSSYRPSSWSLFCVQFWALFGNRMKASRRNFKAWFSEILIPLLSMVLSLVLITQLGKQSNMKRVSLELDHYPSPQHTFYNQDTEVFNIYQKTHDIVKNPVKLLAAGGNQTENFRSFNSDSLQNYTDSHRSKVLGGYFFLNTSSEHYSIAVLQNSTAYQAAPTFINAISESVLAKEFGEFDMRVWNHPFPMSYQQSLLSNEAPDNIASLFGVGLASFPSQLIAVLHNERSQRIQHQYFISGVSIPAYWFSLYLWDLSKYMVIGLTIPIAIKAVDIAALSADSETYSMTWLLFLCFGLSIPVSTYCLAVVTLNNKRAAYVFNLVMGSIAPGFIWLLRFTNEKARTSADILVWPFRLISPFFCFIFGLTNMCSLDYYRIAYDEDQKRTVYDWEIAGADLFVLVVSVPLYFAILFLIQYYKQTKRRKRSLLYVQGTNTDPDLENLEALVAQTDPQEVAVKVASLCAVSSETHSVQQVNFVVPYHQCFALLGPNCAGKTATVRLLTGQDRPTSGSVFINGHNIFADQVRCSIGYCPQVDALSEKLTVREHLKLYAKIRGIPSVVRNQQIDTQLREIGLFTQAHRLAECLSISERRKLSVAIACIGNPAFILLDDPTANLDLNARKTIWHFIANLKKHRSGVLVSTHSLEEAVCDSVGLMVDGQLKCCGSVSYMKTKFQVGFEVAVTIAPPEDQEIDALAHIAESSIDSQGFIEEELVSQVLDVFGLASSRNLIYDDAPQIQQSLDELKRVDAQVLLQWVYTKQRMLEAQRSLSARFGGVSVIERFGRRLKVKVEAPEGMSRIVEFLEDNKHRLNIESYSLSEGTLEQIVHSFADKRL